MIRALLLCLLVMGGKAEAQPTDGGDHRAKEWFINGQVLYQEGRYRDALVAFEAAYRMSSRPNVLRSIAYCYENLGEIGNAIDVLYRYRGLAEEFKVVEIDRHIQRLETRLEKERSPPPPFVDQADTPPPARQIAPRQARRVRKGQIVLYSLAGAGLITGGIFALQASSARQSAAELCSTDDAVFCPRAAAEHINDDRLYSTVADASFGFGGAAALGATLWLLIDNSRSTQVSVVPMGQGVGLVGRF